jgi:hypothetical protein
VSKKIKMKLNDESISQAISELYRYKDWVTSKETELRTRLAMLGATVASVKFSRAIYNGVNDVSVRVDDDGSKAVIYAEGEAVAFIEFGAGAKYGYGHPDAGKFGAGPGTYPGKGHWDDPRGWWFGSGQHSYGNPPAMAMYGAVVEMNTQLTEIAREVFK